ncbi:MAG: hypothetical protein KDD69_15435 [Bdellovibrionales bacterium]|nr:hypothetical protein [Bdellovibrionales bacterium]
MDPMANAISSSLLGACQHVPNYLKSQLKRLSGDTKKIAQKHIRNFQTVGSKEGIFVAQLTHKCVRVELLDALFDSAGIARKLRNEQLRGMLVSSFKAAVSYSVLMYLNVLVARGDTIAPELASQMKAFTAMVVRNAPEVDRVGARMTSAVVNHFEAIGESDPYAAALANHLLNAYADR